jgi:hypothetical protein
MITILQMRGKRAFFASEYVICINRLGMLKKSTLGLFLLATQ